MVPSMAMFPYLISCLLLDCLYARALTVPNPVVISQPVALPNDSNVVETTVKQAACDVPISGLLYSSTTDVSVDPEQPPEGLSIDFQYARSGLMTKFDVWIVITRSIARAALLNWNQETLEPLTFAVRDAHAEIRFVSSINPPRYQTKTIIWTLAEAFDIFNERRHYSNCFLKTMIHDSSGVRTLGVGSIKSTLSTGLGLQGNSSALNLSTETPIELTSTSPIIDPSTPVFINQHSVSKTDDSVSRSNSDNSSSLGAGTRGFSLSINYRDHGETFSAPSFFHIIISLLVYAAQNDPKDAPSLVLTAYNEPENYTFSVGPTSDAARENLPWRLTIPAIGYLPSVMLEDGRGVGGRWAEFTGTIKLDGAYIGKLQLLKGDQRASRPGSCGTARRNIRGVMIDNDNSGDKT